MSLLTEEYQDFTGLKDNLSGMLSLVSDFRINVEPSIITMLLLRHM